jgi:hypothetical protein
MMADGPDANMGNTNKIPEELLLEKGYILYCCKTEEDIQQFKKYYCFTRFRRGTIE